MVALQVNVLPRKKSLCSPFNGDGFGSSVFISYGARSACRPRSPSPLPTSVTDIRMSTPLSARRAKSSRRPHSQRHLIKPTTCSNSLKSEGGDRCQATSEDVTSKTENDVFHEAAIGSMMSIPRDEAADAMPNDSSLSSEPGKPTIPETTTERLSLLTDEHPNQERLYDRKPYPTDSSLQCHPPLVGSSCRSSRDLSLKVGENAAGICLAYHPREEMPNSSGSLRCVRAGTRLPGLLRTQL